MAAVVSVYFIKGTAAPIVVTNPVQRIVVPKVVNTQTFPALALLRLGHLDLPLVTNDQTFYSLTVTPATQAIALPLVANTQTFPALSLNRNVSLPLTTNTQTFYAPTLTKAESIAIPLVTNTQTFYAPTFNQNLTLPLLTVTQVFPPLSLNGGGSPGFILSQPQVTLTSTAGAPPQVNITMGSDIYAGYYLRIQRSSDGVKNASDGTYTNPTLNITHLVMPPEVAALAITNADLAMDGYIDPTGAWFQQYRWEREDGALSAFSNEIASVVTQSTAKWNTITGVNKSKFVTTTDGLQAWCAVNNGAIAGVRAGVEMFNDKGHAELTINAMCSSSGKITFGITNATQDLSVNTQLPGSTTYPGSAISINYNLTSATIGRNGGTQGVSLPAVPAPGDIISLDIDRPASRITYKYFRLATGTTTTLATVTLTSNIPANWFLFSAYNKGTSTVTNRDDGTTNFGALPFTVTPLTGHTFYA